MRRDDTRINWDFTIPVGGGSRSRSGACGRAVLRHNGGKEQSKLLISLGGMKVASRKHLREAKPAGEVEEGYRYNRVVSGRVERLR